MTETVFVSVPKFAELSGLSKDYTYFLIRKREIEFLKIGKKYLIHYPHAMQYLESEAMKAKVSD